MKVLLAILAILYVISWYDLIPDFFIGLGWIDDLIVLFFLWRYFFANKRKIYSTSQKENNQHFKERREGEAFQNKGDDTQKDPFEVLGINRGASQEEIKKAYRELVNQYHPDKVSYLGKEFRELAEVRFKEINKAYQELTSKGH
ncbi:MAG TPA: DnaJ domain-containing protein [Desulfobacteraceae bacterium]|nr:DnaJ domain-containing protein [Desulfobacteraceae bacterium]HPJ66190.1 DnaJ domain-containing protein [Desulfobacteraceae bacterium]HPQ27086.1 DnaJ domain-containing protein [Desulfobacteraceae bacterium]